MRVSLTAEQAISVLPEGKNVHTFADANFGIVGTDWSRENIIKRLECADHIELSGEIARAMNHGIYIYDKDANAEELIFIETNEEKLAALENSGLVNKKTDNEKLKPCPFCGDVATLCRVPSSSKFIVECDECWSQTSEYKTEDAAVAAWNRRVNNE